MLAYQSISFHDAGYLREVMNLRTAREFEAWLERVGVASGNRLLPVGDRHRLLAGSRFDSLG